MKRDDEIFCDWCDGERITCHEGLCADEGEHGHPRGLGAPLTAGEYRPDDWMQFHAACRVKMSELMADLGRKGVKLEIGGIEVHP